LQFQNPDALDENIIPQFPLADYAAKYWISHVRYGENRPTEQKLITRLFHTPGPFIAWVRIFNIDAPWTGRKLDLPRAEILAPIYYASMAGLPEVVLSLIKEGAAVNAQGGWYGNALQAASAKGHVALVKLLLHYKADPNIQGGYLDNPLYAAANNGHLEVVQLLLDHGAHVNAQDSGKNALPAASFKGHDGIVKLLLERGADVNAQGGYYGSALYAASSQGNEEIADLLLQKGADVDKKVGLMGRPLQAAQFRGHEGIVKLLLRERPHLWKQSQRYGNSLQVAQTHDYEDICKVLEYMGEKDYKFKGGLYHNALQAASWRGQKDVVKLLLEKMASSNSPRTYHSLPHHEDENVHRYHFA